MRIKNILVVLVTVMVFVACGGGDYSPKPQAYLRIDMPEHNYLLIDTLPIPADTVVFKGDTMVFTPQKSYRTFPFVFEANKCIELTEKDAPKGEVWVDLLYPQWDGVVFLTYKRLHGPEDLRGQTDTSSRLLEKHYQFTSGIDEKTFEDTARNVYATTWHLRGRSVASTYQFMATDREHHFLRGALFINRAPNNDSLAPVLEYIQADLDHLVETLRWR